MSTKEFAAFTKKAAFDAVASRSKAESMRVEALLTAIIKEGPHADLAEVPDK